MTVVHILDRNVGRLLDTLDELDLAQRTIVILTSDHGFNIGQHGLSGKGNADWMLTRQPHPRIWPDKERPNLFDQEFASLRQASLADRATERLTDFVLRAGRKTGWRLPPEHELCEKLGVGRSTLREATKVLESQGLIKRVQGKGVHVIDRSREATADLLQLSLRRGAVSHEELFEVRTIYEVQAAALAAERATPEDLARIQRELKLMQATDTADEQYIDADLNFHVAVAAATHNRVLSLIVDTILPLLRDAIAATLHEEKRPESRRHHHADIYEAIRTRDANAASEAMASHLAAGKKMMEAP